MMAMGGVQHSVRLLEKGQTVCYWHPVTISVCEDGIVVCDETQTMHLVDLEAKTYRKFGGDDARFDEIQLAVLQF
jgi:hypothetical protein